MNASHLFAGIYWPVMLMVLATGWLLLPWCRTDRQSRTNPCCRRAIAGSGAPGR